jgi:hypothetical protein
MALHQSDTPVKVFFFKQGLGSQKCLALLLSSEELSAIPFRMRLSAKTSNS